VPEIPYGGERRRPAAGAGRGCGAGRGGEFGGDLGMGEFVGAGLAASDAGKEKGGGGERGRGGGGGGVDQSRICAESGAAGRCGWAREVAALGSGAARRGGAP